MRKIIKNSIQCKLCGDVIESTYRHDYVECSCGSCAVDGGHDYLRRCYKDKDCIIELSITEDDEETVCTNKTMIDDKTINETELEMPKSAIEQLARHFLPCIRQFFSTEEGRIEYEEWKAKQDAQNND